MDSIAQSASLVLEIINETASTGDPSIGQRKQPLWPQKSSTTLLSWVTHGFEGGISTYGLINHQRKCFHGWCMDSRGANSTSSLRNHQRNCFHGLRIDSTAQRAHLGSEIILQNWVAADSKNINENSLHGWRMDSIAQTAPLALEIIY
jgi:hypothetical protein